MARNNSGMKTHKLAIAATSFAVEVDTTGNRIQLFPAGEFRACDGRPTDCAAWVLTSDIAKKIIALAMTRKGRFVIDYEHQTLKTSQNGQPAPAAGWFNGHNLVWEPSSGLFVDNVDWTATAAAHIAKREYLYISPVFVYNPKTGEILQILHAALTNNPALDELDEVQLVAASRLAVANFTPESLTMSKELLALLIQKLGLKPDATEEDVMKALTGGTDKPTQDIADLSSQIAVLTASLTDKDSKIAALTTAAKANQGNGQPDLSQYVPLASFAALQADFSKLSERYNTDEATTLITAALSDGRLHKDMEDWAQKLAKENLPFLKDFLSKAPPIAALTGLQTGGQTITVDGKTFGLNAHEIEAAALCNMTLEDYAKAKELV